MIRFLPYQPEKEPGVKYWLNLIFTIGFVKLNLSLVRGPVPIGGIIALHRCKTFLVAPEQLRGGGGEMGQYLRLAGIGLVIIGLVLLVLPILAGIGNLEAVFGFDPLIFPAIGVVLMFIGALLIDRG